MSDTITVQAWRGALAMALVLGLGAAMPARAQDPGAAADAEAAVPDETGEQLRFKRPAWQRLWPLLTVESRDEAVDGPDPAGRGIVRSVDIDALVYLFGYRNEVRRAQEEQIAGDYGFAWLMPIYYAQWTPKAADAWVGPLYGYMRRGEQWRMFIPPLLAGGAGGPDGWDASFLFPLGWAGARGDDWWAMLAPIFWSGGGPDRAYAGLLPLFWYDQRGEDLTLVTPLGGYGRRKDFTYAAVTPLVHHWRDRRRNSGGDVVLPVYFHWFDENESGHLLLPLGGSVWDKRRGTATVFGPVFQTTSADGDETQGGVVPLVWWYSQQSTATSSLTVVPLFYHYAAGDHDRRTVLFPVYWDFDTGRERHQHVWPFYGYDEWRGKSGEVQHQRWSVAFPFFSWWEDHATRTSGWDAPWPIAGGESGENYARARVLPLLWYERTGQSWTLLSAALWFGHGNDDHEWLVWGPLFGYYRNRAANTSLMLAPLSHYWSDGSWSNWSAAFPLFYGASDTAGRWQFRLLWEGLAVDAEGDQAFEWRVLGKFMHYRRLGDQVMFEVNPLFRYETKGRDYTYFDILLGLYSYERIGETPNHGFFWMG